MKTKSERKLLVSLLSVALVTASLALPVRAGIIVNTSSPIAAVINNACTGEPVLLTGELHTLIHITNDRNGGFHFYTHIQPQGVSGEGLVSGRNYHGTGATMDMANDSSGPQVEISYVNNFKIIGQGPGGNFLVHANIHLTVDANGNVAADVVNTSVECR